jgi:hypothetical protein
MQHRQQHGLNDRPMQLPVRRQSQANIMCQLLACLQNTWLKASPIPQ